MDEPRQLYERPRTEFVADFIGESTFLPVQVQGDRVLLHGTSLRLQDKPSSTDAEQLLVVRPEKLDLILEGDAAGMNAVEGTVKELVYQGESFLLYVTLESGAEIVMSQPTRREVLDAIPAAGGAIRLGIHPHDTIVVPIEKRA